MSLETQMIEHAVTGDYAGRLTRIAAEALGHDLQDDCRSPGGCTRSSCRACGAAMTVHTCDLPWAIDPLLYRVSCPASATQDDFRDLRIRPVTALPEDAVRDD